MAGKDPTVRPYYCEFPAPFRVHLKVTTSTTNNANMHISQT